MTMLNELQRGPCRRNNGTFRAHFPSREDAEAFAADSKNIDYHDDIAHLCHKCGRWHLSHVGVMTSVN
jgi:hypothetical protein